MNWRKKGGTAAILSGLVFIIFTAIAVLNYPDYSPYTTYLSDLGVGPTAIFFNVGLVVAGLLGLVLAAGVYQIRSNICVVGTFLLLFTNIALMEIGIFSENFGLSHTFMSWTFFFFATFMLFVVGTGIAKTEKSRTGYITILLGVIIVVQFLILGGAHPITEFIAVALIILWSFLIGLYLIKTSERK
ncbi:MAG: DUF998 domain-containing protein [Nanoarchaeota archaeon]|nr:DUF998 domain-containing protein [Nanoarchaeota archaeon]